MTWRQTEIRRLETQLATMYVDNKGKGGGKGGSSGKGMGKGDIGGKGKSKGEDRPGDWQCLETGCVAGTRLNFARNTHCHFCACVWRPRPARLAAPDVKAAPADADDGWISRKSRNAIRKEKKLERAADKKKKEEGPADAMVEIDGMKDVSDFAVSDNLEAMEKKRLGLPLRQAKNMGALFIFPKENKKLEKSPADIVNESTTCKTAADLAEKDAAIIMYEKFVTEAVGKPEVVAVLQVTLEGVKKDREALSKKGTATVNIEKLKLAQQRSVADWTERQQQVKNSMDTQAVKTQKHREALQEQVEAATKAIKELDTLETDFKQKWKVAMDAEHKQHEEVMVEWQRKVDAAVVVGVPGAVAVQDEEPETDYELEAIWDPLEAPKVTPKNDDEKEWLSQLWANLQIWNKFNKTGVLYRELAGPGALGVVAVKELLGQAFWTRMYGTRQVEEFDEVPLQLKFVLTFTLGAMTQDIVKHVAHGEDLKVAEKAFQTFKTKSLSTRKAEKASGGKSVLKPAKEKSEKSKK